MDKKNTLLLTVIAVATLLVAVVGATFAYFSIGATNSSTSTAIQATTGSVGSVILNTDNSALKIELNATDMAQASNGTDYYAVLSSAYNTSTNRWDTSSDTYTHSILKATAIDAAASNYNCTGTVHAVLAADNGNVAALASILDADGELVLVPGTGVTLANGTITIKDLVTASTTGVDKTFSIPALTSSATPGTDTVLVSAYLKMTNTNAEQNYLENAAFTVTLTAPTFTCQVAAQS